MYTVDVPGAVFPGILGDCILKEGFDATIDFSEMLIGVFKLEGVPIDPEVAIAIDDLAVVDLVGVVCLGEDVLHHRPGVYDPLTHPVVLKRD